MTEQPTEKPTALHVPAGDQVAAFHAFQHAARNLRTDTDRADDAASNALLAWHADGAQAADAATVGRYVRRGLTQEVESHAQTVGLTRDRGNRSDIGTLSAAHVDSLTPAQRVTLANLYTHGGEAQPDGTVGRMLSADRVDAVLRQVVASRLVPYGANVIRRRQSGEGVGTFTVTAAHGANTAQRMDADRNRLAYAADNVRPAFTPSESDAWARLESLAAAFTERANAAHVGEYMRPAWDALAWLAPCHNVGAFCSERCATQWMRDHAWTGEPECVALETTRCVQCAPHGRLVRVTPADVLGTYYAAPTYEVVRGLGEQRTSCHVKLAQLAQRGCRFTAERDALPADVAALHRAAGRWALAVAAFAGLVRVSRVRHVPADGSRWSDPNARRVSDGTYAAYTLGGEPTGALAPTETLALGSAIG